jgi:hypothetical protein
MDNSTNTQLPKTKYYIVVIISLITICLITLTSLSYTKKYPFGRLVFFDLFHNASLSGHPLNHPNNPCERLRCAIVIHRNGGRLGNRMFIFASAYGLARIHGCRLYASEQIVHELKGIFKMSVKENLWLSANQANGLHGVIAKDTVCSFLPEMLRPNAFNRIYISMLTEMKFVRYLVVDRKY